MKKKEIDEQIAEIVMGWTVAPNIYDAENLDVANLWLYNGEPSADTVIGLFDDFNPSTDIAIAFEVRDKIAGMLFSVRLKFTLALQKVISERLGVNESIATILIHSQEIILNVNANDICLAALEAVKIRNKP